MRIERVLIGAVAVGVLAAAGIVVFGPRVADQEAAQNAAHPVPIAQPITPATWPYSKLAILRTQRLSTDILPTSVTTVDVSLIPESARLLATKGSLSVWVVVNEKNDICIVSGPSSSSGSETGDSSACATGPEPKGTGQLVGGGGFGDGDDFSVITDGTPAAGAVKAGFHQIAPNVWSDAWKNAVRRPGGGPADAAAYPAVEPYASFEILRRARTSADAAPSFLTDSVGDSGNPSSAIVLSSLRYGGSIAAEKAWAGVDTKGEACLIVGSETDGWGTSCATHRVTARGSQATGIGFQNASFTLVTDGTPSTDALLAGDVRTAPNVWGQKFDR